MSKDSNAFRGDSEKNTATKNRSTKRQQPIEVRMKEELNGVRGHDDGVSFHSASPIAVGRTVELILCGGTLLVDAKIVECQPVSDAVQGYSLRARYMHTSQDLRELITGEVDRCYVRGERSA